MCSKMQGLLASEIIFQQWLQTQNRRHLSAWVVPTKVQHKGFSFLFLGRYYPLLCSGGGRKVKRSRLRTERLQVWIPRLNDKTEWAMLYPLPAPMGCIRGVFEPSIWLYLQWSCALASVGGCGCTGPFLCWMTVAVWMQCRALLEKKRSMCTLIPKKG